MNDAEKSSLYSVQLGFAIIAFLLLVLAFALSPPWAQVGFLCWVAARVAKSAGELRKEK